MSEVKPGYVYNYTVDMGSGRLLQITGNFAVGATVKDMNEQVDVVTAVINRQQAKASIPAIKQKILAHAANLINIKTDLARIDKRFDGKPMPTIEKNQREQIVTSISIKEEELKGLHDFLAETEKEAL